MTPDFDEPLFESAPLARQLSARHCPDQLTSAPCQDYHAMWQYFRAIGLFSSIASDHDFLVEAIRAEARRGARRVVISATADYGTLARVLHAYRIENQLPEIIVVDLCETPLALNRWYAERHGIAIETVRANVLDYQPDAQVDLVCTHSFLGRLSPEVRRGVVANWQRMLTPGGAVVTTTRVRYGAKQNLISFTTEEVRSRHAEALALAEACRDQLDLAPEVIAEAAEHYAREKRMRPFGSTAEIEGYFQEAGLIIEQLSLSGNSLRIDDRPSGPLRGWHTERVRIVARRP